MGEVITIVTSIFGLLSGSGAFITFALYRKQQKRLKNAEAVEKEVSTLRSTIETLQTNMTFYEERLNTLQKLVIEKDNYIAVLTNDKQTVDIKHAKNKNAINRAHECEYCKGDASKCPVLDQRRKNEAEYLISLEKARSFAKH